MPTKMTDVIFGQTAKPFYCWGEMNVTFLRPGNLMVYDAGKLSSLRQKVALWHAMGWTGRPAGKGHDGLKRGQLTRPAPRASPSEADRRP